MTWSYFHISLPKEGEKLCGDTAVVRVEPDATLFAVIDALGHGPGAAVVAEVGRAYLSEVPLDGDVAKITNGLHEVLRGTRGIAAMCCLVRGSRIEGCGVGNVELRVAKSRVPVILTPGVLGVSLRTTRIFTAALSPGARLVFFSDGISPRLDLARVASLSPEEACKALLSRHRRSHDDATVLIADLDAHAQSPRP